MTVCASVRVVIYGPLSSMTDSSFLQLMWLASPALPIGGFSYSECLEAAVDCARQAFSPMVMRSDTTRMRTTAKGLKPFVMTNLKTQSGLAEVVAFIETKGMLLP